MGIEVDSRVLKMDKVPKALVIYKLKGLKKMVVEKSTNKILGVQIIGHLTAEIIQEAVLAIKFGLKVEDILDTIHVYPTMVEAIKLVAVSFVKDISKLSCCAE